MGLVFLAKIEKYQISDKSQQQKMNRVEPVEEVKPKRRGRPPKKKVEENIVKAEENQSLINLRDTLLPKLLLGEVEIPDFINEGE